MSFFVLSLLSSIFLSSVVAAPLSSSSAVQLDLVGKRRPLHKRDEFGVFGNGSLGLRNNRDIDYRCNVTLGGRAYQVEIDSGSTDLWVDTQGLDPPGTVDTDILMDIFFGGGDVHGSIHTVQMDFNGFTIDDQAYLNVFENNEGISGIIGLGPSLGEASEIREKSQGEGFKGDPPLDRIFQQNPTMDRILTLYLSRDATVENIQADQFPAQLTIGKVIPGLEAIQNAPKLPVVVNQFGLQHWETLLDANGIIGPNGQRINTKTVVQDSSDGGSPEQLRIIFDSGFTVPQLPRDVFDAIYKDIPGAQFIEDGTTLNENLTSQNFYRIPCDQEVTVSFVFSGQEFPISAIDLNRDKQFKDSNGTEICISGFGQSEPSEGIDAILGEGFLRNTYILFNFGNFVGGSSSNVANPYIQLLSINDKTKIHTDFVNARLGGNDPNNNSNPTGNTDSTDNHNDDNSSLSHGPRALAVGMSAIAALVTLLGS
ncbi:hypothetical protein VKT23_003645 [Stygiomarasmius scandens]|uniref:Peptidase A1 domain-containing protein n=1 Tax=Marasmiellus scandens TaxID=2682957 RepID=A0ABR1JYJ8_9AGAR